MQQAAVPCTDPPYVALWGDDHPALRNLAVTPLGADTAVGISAGRLPKSYAHLDPNEDAVGATTGPFGTLLAVADGHNGFDAARAAIEAVVDSRAVLCRPLDPGDAVAELLTAARDRVRAVLAAAAPERRRSRTALSVALAAGGTLTVGGWGDTTVLRLRGRRAKVVGPDGPFLEPASELPRTVQARLKDGDMVLVCSDGLRDYLAGDWEAHAAQVAAAAAGAESAARKLIEVAWAGGAGDHIAVAVSRRVS